MLSGHAGSLLVAGELEKRGILVNVLPETFEDYDLLIGKKGGDLLGTVQVKSCHPDRMAHGQDSIELGRKSNSWSEAKEHDYVAVVWLGSILSLEPPKYWIATKKEVGNYIRMFQWPNREHRFGLVSGSRYRPLKPEWKNNWRVFAEFQPPMEQLVS